MRTFLILFGLLGCASSVLAAMPLRPKPTLQLASQALKLAGPPASDAEVATAYPRFMLHPRHPPAPWFVASTDSGCLYYAYDPSYAPPVQWPAKVANWMREHFAVKWTGTPCTKGQLISGQGTLSWGDANIRNAGFRKDDFTWMTGTMNKGVFTGMVKVVYTAQASASEQVNVKNETEMFGGCINLDPGRVMPPFQMCQPRLP